MKQRIVFNGIEYGHPDEMPADVRVEFDRAMGLLADRNANGLPDVIEQSGDASVQYEAHVYSDLTQLTPDDRNLVEQLRAGGKGRPLLTNSSFHVTFASDGKSFKAKSSLDLLHFVNRALFYLLLALLALFVFKAWPR